MMVRSPGEQASVVRLANDFLLETLEGPPTLAIDGGHVDVEETKETVSLVLDARRITGSGPSHAFSDGSVEHRSSTGEVVPIDVRDVAQKGAKVSFRAE